MNTTTKTLESTAMPCRAEIGPTLLKILLCDDDPLFLESLRANIRSILNAHKISATIQAFRYAEVIPYHFLSSYLAFKNSWFSYSHCAFDILLVPFMCNDCKDIGASRRHITT